MHETAPGSRSEPHAGHFVGAPLAAAGGGGAGGGGAAAGGRGVEPDAAPVAAATSWGAAAPTTNMFWHFGQRTCLPVASSGTCIRVWHFVQLMICGMIDLCGLRGSVPQVTLISSSRVPRSAASHYPPGCGR